MHVVKIGSFLLLNQVLPHRVFWLSGADDVPSHVRDFQSRFWLEFHDGSFENTKSCCIWGLVTAFEEELVTYADAQEGFVITDPLMDDVEHTCLLELS